MANHSGTKTLKELAIKEANITSARFQLKSLKNFTNSIALTSEDIKEPSLVMYSLKKEIEERITNILKLLGE